MNETFPVLYILMRTDLTSMNAGKAMAQASHASNAFIHRFGYLKETFVDGVRVNCELIDSWKKTSSQGFGTVLVLAVNEQQMRFSVDAAKRYGMPADIVHDDTYPIRVDRDFTSWWNSRELIGGVGLDNLHVGDGYVTVDMDTCAYVFADKNEPITGMLLGGYKLHP